MDKRLIYTAAFSVGLHAVALAGWPEPVPQPLEKTEPTVITVNLTPPPPPPAQKPVAVPTDDSVPELISLEPDPFDVPIPEPVLEPPQPITKPIQQPAPVIQSPVYDPQAKLQYEHLLAAHLEKHKKYPKLALRRNIEGSPVVRLTVGLNGSLINVELEESCSFAVLDRAAISLVEAASPLPPLPSEFTSPVTYVLPVHYLLGD